jgi:hypothetical protein
MLMLSRLQRASLLISDVTFRQDSWKRTPEPNNNWIFNGNLKEQGRTSALHSSCYVTVDLVDQENIKAIAYV